MVSVERSTITLEVSREPPRSPLEGKITLYLPQKDTETKTLSLNDERDIEEVAEILATGQGIAFVHTAGVYGIWVNASNAEAVEWVYQQKRREPSKRLVTLLPFQRLLEIVDLERVDPRFQETFASPTSLADHYLMPHHLIVPIVGDADLPAVLVTNDPDGASIVHFGTSYPPLVRLRDAFYAQTQDGVLGGTSFNVSEQAPLIKTYYEATAYYQTHMGGKDQIKFVSDAWFETEGVLRGSHTIIDSRDGTVARTGSVHVSTFERLWGIELTLLDSAGDPGLGLSIAAASVETLRQVPREETIYQLSFLIDEV